MVDSEPVSFLFWGTPKFPCLLHDKKLFLSKRVGVLGQILHMIFKEMYMTSLSIDLNDVTCSVKSSSTVSLQPWLNSS